MRQVTKDMIKIYKPLTTDWMNYKVTKENPITFHHIIKAENGGKFTKDNCALLTRNAHEYIHLIEYKEEKMYYLINKMLEIINRQQTPPTDDQRFVIEYVLRQFEALHIDDIGSKGKLLVKDKYLERESL